MTEIRNPYAAPDAVVADVAVPTAAPPRPEHVRRACMLLWWSFAISVLGTPFGLSSQSQVPGVDIGFVAMMVTAAFSLIFAGLITWWFTAKLSAGRNWMRWLLNILFGISFVILLILLAGFREAFGNSFDQPVAALLTLAQFGLSIAALVLINTSSSREWFAAMKRSRP